MLKVHHRTKNFLPTALAFHRRLLKVEGTVYSILRQIEGSNIKVVIAYLLHRINLSNQFVKPGSLKATLIR